MLVPLSWLKNYVPITVPPRELAHRLTMGGTEIGAVHETGADWDKDKVLVGQVLTVEPHPNADRLTLPTVDLGNGEAATVVCGAPNVAAGQKIAFAREGARLMSSRSGEVEPLKAAKIRGVLSSGMVCSELELGLSENHEGILVLDDDAPVGGPLADYLGDAVLDADVTPNRPDCLSVLGIAHEAAALTGETVSEPDLSYVEAGGPIDDLVHIHIEDPDLCPRYAASLVTGVTVGESPRWLKDALTRAGQRPISSIVDITNYVMLEYGQPLHAFDFDKLKEGTVIIRAARKGESLATLDGETYELRPPMLAIADSKDPVALAGVVGGTETSVGDGTTSILIESANFDPVNTRHTRDSLRLSTEASYRFERGIPADLVPRALKRATQLVLEIAGGTAAQGIVDIYPDETAPRPVKISRSRVRQVLGVDFSLDRMQDVLSSLGFERSDPPKGADTDDELWMDPPYWRSDIAIEDDLVEEVARVVGYDSVPTTMMSTQIPHHKSHPQRDLRESVKDILAASGMQETISYPLTERDTLTAVGALDDGPEPMEVANPLSSEMRYLRTSLRGSVLHTLSANRRVSQGAGIRIFETGRVYLPKEEAKERELPDEKEMVVGVLSGPRSQASWLAPKGDMDFFDAKGVLETLFERLGVSVDYEPTSHSTMRTGRASRLVSDGTSVGVVGEVHPGLLERFDLSDSRTAMFEIDLESLYDVTPKSVGKYTATSRFPESERDLALVVDGSVTSAQIRTIIERHKFVKSSGPVDLYAGEGVPRGKKSIAFRIVFQSDVSTLTTELVDRAQGDILRQLQRETGAELRE